MGSVLIIYFTQEQGREIQAQAEQIAQLKSRVQGLRDEITPLKNTPKRLKFRPPGKKNFSSHKKNQNVPNPHSAPAPRGKKQL